MGRQAGRIMRRLAFSAVLMLSTLLIVTPFALAQDSEQSIPQTQIAFGLPDVVADELPGAPGVEGAGAFALTPVDCCLSLRSLGPLGFTTRQHAPHSALTQVQFARGPPKAA